MTPLFRVFWHSLPSAAPQLLTVACQPFAPTIPFHFSSHSHPIRSLSSHPPSGSHPILHLVLIPSSIRFSSHPPSGSHPILHQVLIPSSIRFSSRPPPSGSLIPSSSRRPPSSSHHHPIVLHHHPIIIPSSSIRFSSHHHPIVLHQVLIPSSSIRFSSHHHPIVLSSHSRWLSVSVSGSSLSLPVSCLVSLSLSLLCLSVCVCVSVLGAPWSSFLLASVSYVGSFPFAVAPFVFLCNKNTCPAISSSSCIYLLPQQYQSGRSSGSSIIITELGKYIINHHLAGTCTHLSIDSSFLFYFFP